ncbi:MAG: MraY family glycosyltransferase [Dysgonomonas sp.]|nr:MraY family glycosyltransferase [Dysgonomonas sp.]
MKVCIYCFLPFIISLLSSWFLIPQIQFVALKKKLFDIVDERKVHIGIVPRLGGVAFFPTFMLVSSLFLCAHIIWREVLNLSINIESIKEWLLALCCSLIMYLTGIGDDLVGLRYRQKFTLQILVAFIFIASDLWINNLYGILGIHEIPFYIGAPLTMFIIVFILNAINLIDGIDGLASGLSMIAFLFYGCLFMYLHLWFYSIQAFIALGMLVPFFYYNVFGDAEKGRKIFMGDGGALTIGMLLSIFTIKLCHFEPEIAQMQIPHSIVIAFSLLIVPMFDVIRVVIHRLRSRCHPFKPDKNHIHHKFLSLGLSHKSTMIVILLIAVFFGTSNVLLAPYVNINILLIFDIVLWTVMHILITIKIRKKCLPETAETYEL